MTFLKVKENANAHYNFFTPLLQKLLWEKRVLLNFRTSLIKLLKIEHLLESYVIIKFVRSYINSISWY